MTNVKPLAFFMLQKERRFIIMILLNYVSHPQNSLRQEFIAA